MGLELIESLVRGKVEESACEDAIFFDGRFAAVIDGATAKRPWDPSGVSPGRAIAQRIARALPGLPADATGPEAIAFLSEDIAAWRADTRIPGDEAPSASIAILSGARGEVWMLGDCLVSVGGLVLDTGKRVDEAAAAFRAAFLSAEIARRVTVDALRADDPGRAAILPLLTRQQALRNAPPGNPYAYGALDGNAAAVRHLRTYPVWDPCEVVLATDGYIDPGETLEEAEGYLARTVATDPRMMLVRPSTKGVDPGAESFDDRAYLRVTMTERARLPPRGP